MGRRTSSDALAGVTPASVAAEGFFAAMGGGGFDLDLAAIDRLNGPPNFA